MYFIRIHVLYTIGTEYFMMRYTGCMYCGTVLGSIVLLRYVMIDCSIFSMLYKVGRYNDCTILLLRK